MSLFLLITRLFSDEDTGFDKNTRINNVFYYFKRYFKNKQPIYTKESRIFANGMRINRRIR